MKTKSSSFLFHFLYLVCLLNLDSIYPIMGTIFSTNNELIEHLIKQKILKTESVIESMKKVDRKNYVPKNQQSKAYMDSPQPIGYSATISAPHMHGMQLELLHLEPGQKVLDVGSGSGIICAYIGHIVGKKGKVFGIEHIDELVDWSLKNIKRDSPELIEENIVDIQVGDGFKGIEGELFDSIHVGAAAPEIPQALIDQLKVGGHLVIPLGKSSQALYDVVKLSDGSLEKNFVTSVSFVPLCDKEDQLKKKEL
eukprot:Anaeramoba_ignava/a4371_6.p1 GENE.a4371_6~~a4371_6.p1  ORF type:complete len:253 (+),score=85.84 a4371_6:19-777(+)